jgi:hypothetical protein
MIIFFLYGNQYIKVNSSFYTHYITFNAHSLSSMWVYLLQ